MQGPLEGHGSHTHREVEAQRRCQGLHPADLDQSLSPVRGRVESPDEVARKERAKVLASELAEQLQEARRELDTVRPIPEPSIHSSHTHREVEDQRRCQGLHPPH